MFDVISLPGLTPYAEALKLQRSLVARRVAGEIGDTVIFLEHFAVITRGRGLQASRGERHRPLVGPIPVGIEYFECERGGDLTAHEPGQLVIYPIIWLGGRRDIGEYLRRLERWIGLVLKKYGLNPSYREGATGVWVGDRKVASIGITVRKWVTSHGIGLNVVNDRTTFKFIEPCGFSSDTMTSIDELMPSCLQKAWRPQLESDLVSCF